MKESTDRALRAMADLENMRERTNRQAESSRKFAVQVGPILAMQSSGRHRPTAGLWLTMQLVTVARTRCCRSAQQTTGICMLQGFAKDMLEVADNLERAFEVAGEDAQRVQELEPERARTLLGSLLNGLQMTDRILLQVGRPAVLPIVCVLMHDRGCGVLCSCWHVRPHIDQARTCCLSED